MANYTATQLLEARFRFNEMFKKPEMRPKPNPVLDLMMRETSMLVPAFETIKNSDQRTKRTHILNRTDASSGTARSHSHAGNVGDSSIATLTWITRTRYFKMSAKMGDRNEENWSELFANRLLTAIMGLHEDIETYAIAWLNTNKSQVVKSLTPANVAWDAGDNVAEVAKADKDWFTMYAKSFMAQQHYNWGLDCVADARIYALVEQALNQGGGNSTNLGFQAGGIEYIPSIDDLTKPTGHEGSAYLIPKGTFGMIPWIPKVNRDNYTKGIYEYSNIADPMGSGLTFAVHSYSGGADNSGTYGETQDVNLFFEVSIDLTLVKSMLSTANETPVFKIGLLN